MELEIIKHGQITENDLKRVISIKNTVWPHPFDSQMRWIQKFQKSEDFHVFLNDNNEDLAYMDLCPIRVLVDGKQVDFLGLGNICTKTHGLGHGGILIEMVNDYLLNNNLKGLLFCKEGVANFYTRYGWTIIPNNKIVFSDINNEGIKTMSFNMSSFEKAEYCDRSF